MTRSSTYFTPDVRERIRRRLLERRTMLSTLLAEVAIGQDMTGALQALGLIEPGVRPGEALRKALAQVERSRLLLVSDDDRYGCCEVCGGDLGHPALERAPWADRCAEHAA